ncbi:hypothetical protein G5V59_11895 [Nocardioides sp. W3-2-3]|uniref:MCE family protein n=1 Tax=Nocardioides convexus TaxID=2712224 RepID=UPI0024182A1A|nr:MCE family protein [Nocardioides convexus]NHA00495.1 hypothetical protein [Nocardioides convexus]
MSGGMGRLRDALLGVGYGVLVLAIGLGTWLAYNQVFTDRSDITLTTGTLGNALQKGSDVKAQRRAGRQGERDRAPRRRRAADPGAAARRARQVRRRPPRRGCCRRRSSASGTSPWCCPARADRPWTPATPSGRTPRPPRSSLEEVFDQPAAGAQGDQAGQGSPRRSASLALALRGNGADIGEAMASWGDYLTKINPLTPKAADDLASFGRVANTYADAAPDLLDALDSMTVTSKTLVDQQSQVNALFASVIAAADETNSWLIANSDTIITLSKQSRRALAAVAPYATEFPCLFRSLRDFIPVMDKTLGKGTKEPGVHVVLNVTPSRGKYVIGRDDPKFATKGAPRCPYQDGSVRPARATGEDDEPERILPPPSDRTRAMFAENNGLGEANSPAENQADRGA